MIRHDLDRWPLVITTMTGPPTLQDYLAFLATWSEWLDRGEAFATFRHFTDPASLHHPEGGARDAKAWLQANVERVRSLVVGMATIVPAESFELASRMDAQKLFGVPARTFARMDEGLTWIGEQLAAAGFCVDVRDAAAR